MTVDAKIMAALSPFGDPVERSVYHGDAKRYYTFNYTTLAADFGDDEPQHERYLIQVHLFAPLNENILQQVRKTKKALYAAGFVYPDTRDSSDDDSRHIVFESETAEAVDYGED